MGSTGKHSQDYDGKAEIASFIKTRNGKIAIVICVAVLIAAVVSALFATHIIGSHTWAEADCTHPRTCTVCGRTEGAALGHDWRELTCSQKQTCRRCGAASGEELPHTWIEATCVKPKTCEVCGKMEGSNLGHDVSEWVVDKEATCSEEGLKHGLCLRCGQTAESRIPKLSHTEGEWVVSEDVTVSSSGAVTPGRRALTCSACGETIREEPYTIELTTSQKNALRMASSYLNTMPFSPSGLSDQLEFEGFSSEDAKFAADHCGANWDEQAKKMAKSYLNAMPFSHSGLVDQLVFEGFTYEQAETATTAAGL